MAKRKFIDWDSIEPLYRAGFLSLFEICDQYHADHVHSQVWKITVTHAAIIKKAKEKKWSRNLADKVKERIKERLVTKSVTGCNQTISDNDIIERAAEAGVSVIIRHQEEIKALLFLEDKFLIELGADPKKLHFASYQGDLFSEEVGLTITEKSIALKNLTSVRAQRITLERQAHNLEDVKPTDPGDTNIIINPIDEMKKRGIPIPDIWTQNGD